MNTVTAQRSRKPVWHLNRRWTLADMDLIERKARMRATASEIAAKLGCSRIDIIGVCRRNGIKLWGME